MSDTITITQYRATAKKRNKYGAKKTTVGDRTYDSKREAQVCEALILREKAGDICDLELQRPYALIGPDGMLITTYRCDAAFFDLRENRYRVIDVKGGKATQTEAFRLKKKMMKSFLGIEVEVVQ